MHFPRVFAFVFFSANNWSGKNAFELVYGQFNPISTENENLRGAFEPETVLNDFCFANCATVNPIKCTEKSASVIRALWAFDSAPQLKNKIIALITDNFLLKLFWTWKLLRVYRKKFILMQFCWGQKYFWAQTISISKKRTISILFSRFRLSLA